MPIRDLAWTTLADLACAESAARRADLDEMVRHRNMINQMLQRRDEGAMPQGANSAARTTLKGMTTKLGGPCRATYRFGAELSFLLYGCYFGDGGGALQPVGSVPGGAQYDGRWTPPSIIIGGSFGSHAVDIYGYCGRRQCVRTVTVSNIADDDDRSPKLVVSTT